MDKPSNDTFRAYLVHLWINKPGGTKCGITLEQWLAMSPNGHEYAHVYEKYTTCESCRGEQ